MTRRFRITNDMILCFIVQLFCIWCLPSDSSAQVVVQTSVISFRGNQIPVTNVSVRNSADRPLPVATRVMLLEKPGTKEEWEVPSEDVVVSPKTFLLPPKGQRVVRILLKNPKRDVEKAYRAYFTPTIPKDDEKADMEGLKTGSEEQQIGLTVATAMGILLFAEPNDAREDLDWERKGRSLTFTNNGNVNVLVSDVLSCTRSATETEDTCVKIPPIGKRIYAGNSFTWGDIDEKTFIKFNRRQGTQNMKSVKVD